MSKDLEKEYKEHIEREISLIDADALWNRIEAALPEKEIDSNEETTIPNDNKIVSIKEKKKFKYSTIIAYGGTLIAACILIVLLLPAMRSVVKLGGRDETATATATVNSNSDDRYSSVAEVSPTMAEESNSATDYFEITKENVEKSDSYAVPQLNKSESAMEMITEETDLSVEADFNVLEKTDKFYRCLATSDLMLPNENSEFYILIADNDFEVGSDYSMELVLLYEEDGLYYFEIKE